MYITSNFQCRYLSQYWLHLITEALLRGSRKCTKHYLAPTWQSPFLNPTIWISNLYATCGWNSGHVPPPSIHLTVDLSLQVNVWAPWALRILTPALLGVESGKVRFRYSRLFTWTTAQVISPPRQVRSTVFTEVETLPSISSSFLATVYPAEFHSWVCIGRSLVW